MHNFRNSNFYQFGRDQDLLAEKLYESNEIVSSLEALELQRFDGRIPEYHCKLQCIDRLLPINLEKLQHNDAWLLSLLVKSFNTKLII